MPIQKLRKLDTDTGGVTIPKDDLRREGLLEDGELVEGERVEVRRVDDGEWKVRRISDFPV